MLNVSFIQLAHVYSNYSYSYSYGIIVIVHISTSFL